MRARLLRHNGRLVLSRANRALIAKKPQSPTSMTLVDYVGAWAGNGLARATEPVFQRKAGTIIADLPVLFGYTGPTPSNPQARVVRSTNGATIVDWRDLEMGSADGSLYLGFLTNVPQGIKYRVETRDGLAPTNPACLSPASIVFGVGANILAEGQSNQVTTFNCGSYADIIPGKGVSEFDYYNAGNVYGAVFDDAGWHGMSNGDAASPYYTGPAGSSNIGGLSGGLYRLIRQTTAALKAKYGYDVPVGVIPWAFNATSIDAYFTTGDKFGPLYNGAGTSGKTFGFKSPKNVLFGDFEIVDWYQGENNTTTGTRTGYKGDLNTLYGQLLGIVSQYGRTATDLWFFPCTLGNSDVTANPRTEVIRQAIIDFCDEAPGKGWPKVKYGWSTFDLPRDPGNTLHFSDQAGTGNPATRSFRRKLQSILYGLGCATFSGAGPRITTTSAVSTNGVFKLTVTHDGGTALTTKNGSTAVSGVYLNSVKDPTVANPGVEIPVTSATITGVNEISVAFTLPNGVNLPIYARYMSGRIGEASSCNPDISNPAVDNTVYPTANNVGGDTIHASEKEAYGLPLQPTVDAITIT